MTNILLGQCAGDNDMKKLASGHEDTNNANTKTHVFLCFDALAVPSVEVVPQTFFAHI